MRALEDVQADVKALIFSTPKERTANGLPQSAKEALNKAAEVVWNHLLERGKAFHSGNLGYVLLEDHVPVMVSKDGHEFAYIMNEYGLQPGAKEKDHVGKYIGMMCVMKGEPADFRISCHYDKDTNTAYMSELRGQMLRIRKDGVDRVPNGTDDVLFLFPEGYEEVDIMARRKWAALPFNSELDLVLLRGLEFEDGPLSYDEKKRLLMVYLVSLFMPGIIREKLIFTVLGPTGSGKTYLLRVIGKLLMGSSFEVSELSNDIRELETVLVNSPFVVLDEVSGIPGAVMAVLKKTVTGGKMQRRELYTTSRMVEEPYRAQIAISTLAPPFHNQEETNRQLAITLKKREGFVDEAVLLRKVEQARSSFLNEMVTRIQVVLRAIDGQENYAPTVSVRLAGFAALFMTLMRAEDPENGESGARDILKHWREEQEEAVFADSDLAEALQGYITSDRFEAGEALTATALLERLKDHWSGKPYWSENAERLAHALLRSEEAFRHRFGLIIGKPDSHTKSRMYRFTPPAASETEAQTVSDDWF